MRKNSLMGYHKFNTGDIILESLIDYEDRTHERLMLILDEDIYDDEYLVLLLGDGNTQHVKMADNNYHTFVKRA